MHYSFILTLLFTFTQAATPTLPSEILPSSTVYPSLLGPPGTSLTTYATVYPTIPATVFSTNYFASLLHITGCPTAILPSPTAFIDANGQETSFLTLGCSGAPAQAQACQAGASTFGASGGGGNRFCCPGGGVGWTSTQFATNAILTATATAKTAGSATVTAQMVAQGAWCFSSIGASFVAAASSTLPSDTSTSVLYPASTTTATATGPTPTAYPTALSVSTVSETSLLPLTTLASGSSGWGNPALTVIVTAASYNKKRQVMASSAVVLNDLVFVRAVTVSAGASTSSSSSASAGAGAGASSTTPSTLSSYGTGIVSASSTRSAGSATGVSGTAGTGAGASTSASAAVSSAATSAVASIRAGNGGGSLVDGLGDVSMVIAVLVVVIVGVTNFGLL